MIHRQVRNQFTTATVEGVSLHLIRNLVSVMRIIDDMTQNARSKRLEMELVLFFLFL